MLRCRLRKPENAKSLSLYLSLSAWHFEMDKKFAHRSIMQDRQTGEPIKTLASPSSCSEENLGWCIRFCWHKNHKILSIIIWWWWSIIVISKKIDDQISFADDQICPYDWIECDVQGWPGGVWSPDQGTRFCWNPHNTTLAKTLPKTEWDVPAALYITAKQPPDASTRKAIREKTGNLRPRFPRQHPIYVIKGLRFLKLISVRILLTTWYLWTLRNTSFVQGEWFF